MGSLFQRHQRLQCISGSKAQVRNIHLAGDEAGQQQVAGAAEVGVLQLQVFDLLEHRGDQILKLLHHFGVWEQEREKSCLVSFETRNCGIGTDEVLVLQVVVNIVQVHIRFDIENGINRIKVIIRPKHTANITLPTNDDSWPFDKAFFVVVNHSA